jgi:50S ribosomal subunit-associated GTPase HflX
MNKIDLLGGGPLPAPAAGLAAQHETCMISALAGDGLEVLRQRLGALVLAQAAAGGADVDESADAAASRVAPDPDADDREATGHDAADDPPVDRS